MLDRLATGVFCQVGLSNISTEAATFVDEDVVPGLSSGRMGFIGVVPGIARHTAGINGDNHSAVSVEFMNDDQA